MNRFVRECQREWRRLGVPDAIAAEMAADLTADLAEAEAEGASPGAVLGSAAVDPRAFAASWASARGVTNLPPASAGSQRTSVVLAGCVALLIAAIIAGAAMLVSGAGVVVLQSHAGGGAMLTSPGSLRSPAAVPPLALGGSSGIDLHALGWLLLLGGVAGILVMLLSWSLWRSWPGVSSRPRRGHGPASPSAAAY
jgi:hypothetical protein